MTLPYILERLRSLKRRASLKRAENRSRGTETRGVQFAATGTVYNILARRAARRLRAVMPDIEVDLYTDTMIDDPVFDQVHLLSKDSHRPKVEALRRSRFDLTLMLDADIYAVTDVREVFDLMGRYDIIGVHGIVRTRRMGYGNPRIPRSFAVINSGVLVTRKTPSLITVLRDWAAVLPDDDEALDQPHLRRLLWETPEIRLGILPLEYNSINQKQLKIWAGAGGAPRLLHMSAYHQMTDPGDPMTPLTLREVLSEQDAKHVEWLVANDFELNGATGVEGKRKPST